MWNFPTKNCTAGGGGGREIGFASTLERVLDLGPVGMLWDCEEHSNS
jgi:hypothetical protein